MVAAIPLPMSVALPFSHYDFSSCLDSGRLSLRRNILALHLNSENGIAFVFHTAIDRGLAVELQESYMIEEESEATLRVALLIVDTRSATQANLAHGRKGAFSAFAKTLAGLGYRAAASCNTK